MEVGRIYVPEIPFPPGMDEQLASYIEQTGEGCSYISLCGVDSPDLLRVDEYLFRVFAAIRYLQEDPDNGLAAINLAFALEDYGNVEGAVAVLLSLEAAGCPGLYRSVWYESPAFVIGWILSDQGRREESLAHYQRATTNDAIENKGAVWAHMGSVYHELGRFAEAVPCYERAVASFQEELRMAGNRVRNPHLSPEEVERSVAHSVEWAQEQISLITKLKDCATNHLACSAHRKEGGVELVKITHG